MSKARIFISYKRDVEPDERLALQIFDHFAKEHDPFIDQVMLVGARWAERIQEELEKSDFLISLLSEDSVHSEMVKGEIETANQLYKNQESPTILPVRVNYTEPLEYPLSAYLNAINWASWKSDDDTEALLANLTNAVNGGELATTQQERESLKPNLNDEMPIPLAAAQPPSHLELPEGTMDPHSAYYVERASDKVAQGAITKPGGVTITIKGPRQMGKSSLLMRIIQSAAKNDKQVVFLDFQLFDESTLRDADKFFKLFCSWLTDELDMEDRVDEYWSRPLGNSQLCTRYLERYLLKELGKPLVLAMDEVESVYEAPFRSDFFSMLRSWHNERAYKSSWKNLDMVLVTSTEPYQLISNLNQSPFNVGEIVNLEDFELPQLEELNRRHPNVLPNSDLNRLSDLLGGHPYLTRRAMYLVLSGRISVSELIEQSTADRGPFGDHLRYHLFRIQRDEELVDCLKQILRGRECTDQGIFWRLRGAGLVRKDGEKSVPRCNLYADYFKSQLDV